MADRRNMSAWERRLKEIEREKAELRTQIRAVERWPDSPQPGTPPGEPRLRDAAIPVGYRGAHPALLRDNPELLEPGSADLPPGEIAVDFAPGPDGLATKRVVMPRLQRTDLLRPATGGAPTAAGRLAEPRHDQLRNYYGVAGLKRVREARREQGSQRARTVFMVGMVLVLSYVLFKMLT